MIGVYSFWSLTIRWSQSPPTMYPSSLSCEDEALWMKEIVDHYIDYIKLMIVQIHISTTFSAFFTAVQCTDEIVSLLLRILGAANVNRNVIIRMTQPRNITLIRTNFSLMTVGDQLTTHCTSSSDPMYSRLVATSMGHGGHRVRTAPYQPLSYRQHCLSPQ